jgi:precorrin-8X/cobalt-precorrin-8 methylmutase
MSRFDYSRDPLEIERQSFARIRELTDLGRFDPEQQQLAMRLVHTGGDPTLVADLWFSTDAVAAGLKALEQKAAILCDVEMVRQGLSRRYLDSTIHCFLNDEGVSERASQRGETRSMAALAHWEPYLADSLVAIGNAPTALFRLLEMLYAGAPRPALIIGMPVGFIGAEEAKEALIEYALAQCAPCITLRGRRGGSALTAAALNALARLARGIRY